MSEIFLEKIEHQLGTCLHLITGTIAQEFIFLKDEDYWKEIRDKCNSLPNCVGFIDLTVIEGVRQKVHEVRLVASYKSHSPN